MTYISTYLDETKQIADIIEQQTIARAARLLSKLINGSGRLFILGNGGSAANASHAVNDFRKIAHIEAYAPTDNVAELTAWTNDEGWDCTFVNYLKGSRFHSPDQLLVLSVGGGSDTTSVNLVRAMAYAQELGSPIISIVSRDGGEAVNLSDVTIWVPVVSDERITPHAESWQSIILHLLANVLKENAL